MLQAGLTKMLISVVVVSMKPGVTKTETEHGRRRSPVPEPWTDADAVCSSCPVPSAIIIRAEGGEVVDR